MKSEKTARRLTAIDIFIILAVVAAIVAAGLRIWADQNTEPTVVERTDDEYIISFVSYGMRSSTAKLLSMGDMFYLSSGVDEFGELQSEVSITPAEVYMELENGEYIKTYAEENGDNTKVDVSGEFRVKGCRNLDGLMYINGTFYIAPNMGVTVFNNFMSLSFTVTGIEKVS